MPDFEDKFVKVDGLREVDMMLKEIGPELGFKALRAGMMKATLPVLKAARAAALATGLKGFDSNAMAAAMGRGTRKESPTTTTLSIGPRNKNKKALAIYNEYHGTEISRLNYFHLVEWGSAHGPAQPFMRPAFAATAPQAVRNLTKEIGAAIDKIKLKYAST